MKYNQNGESNLDVIRSLAMAKDAFGELAQMTIALEGVMDIEKSAIMEIQRRNIESAKLFNEFKSVSETTEPANEPIVPNLNATR